MFETENTNVLKVTRCEIIQLSCFDLGERLDLAKIHENILNEPWVGSSYFGQKKNLERGSLLDLFFETEAYWSDYFREKNKFLRITLKPFSIKFPADEKGYKMEIVFTVYRTGFASLALWIHYQGKGLRIDDILAVNEGKISLTYNFPAEIPNTSKKEMTGSSFHDTLRVFFHNKIMQTTFNTVKELENGLREKSEAPYTYYVILETEPDFESPDKLVNNYPLEMAALLDGSSGEWKYERKDQAMRRLKEDISFTVYERFYVGYYDALELHSAFFRRYLESEARKNKKTYNQQLILHILYSLIDIELCNYLFVFIRYLNEETSRYLGKGSSLEELTSKTREILLDIEEYYDVSFEGSSTGKEWLKEAKEKMGIEEMFSSLKMKIDYLRALAQCEFQIVSQKQEFRFSRKVSILTVVLTLAALSEVLIGYAQINPSFRESFMLLAFLLPVMLVLITLLLLSR